MYVCSRCGSDAGTIRLDQRRGSQVRRYWLCDACAAELGVMSGKPAVLPRFRDLFSHLFFQRQESACPDCGQTVMEVRRTGRLGCPTCYATFYQEVGSRVGEQILQHGHVGALPKRLRPLRWTYLERERIRDRLNAALADEEYEKAAELRDEIRRRDEIHWSSDE
ncbi:MAG: hypothetical protein ACLFO1_03470 [Spirochaetaceae bacterium]